MSETKQRTISKNFDDDEILFKAPDGTLYLKQGVRRRPKQFMNYWDEQENDFNNINYYARFWDKVISVIKVKQEEQNYNQENE